MTGAAEIVAVTALYFVKSAAVKTHHLHCPLVGYHFQHLQVANFIWNVLKHRLMRPENFIATVASC
jgi:hypothetical protein